MTGTSRWSSSRAIPASSAVSGSSPGEELHFRPPSSRVPEPAFQVATLPGYERATMTGAVVYPDVWWQHDAIGVRPEA